MQRPSKAGPSLESQSKKLQRPFNQAQRTAANTARESGCDPEPQVPGAAEPGGDGEHCQRCSFNETWTRIYGLIRGDLQSLEICDFHCYLPKPTQL